MAMTAYSEAHERSKTSPPLVGNLWDLQGERSSFAKKALDQWMATKELSETGRPFDSVISPTTAYSACPQFVLLSDCLNDLRANGGRHTFDHVTYTSLWNLTDQSVAMFPVTFAQTDDVKPEYEGRNAVEQKIWDRCEPSTMSHINHSR